MGKNLNIAVHNLNVRCGTRSYMSPEVLKQRPYSYEVDVFAVAIVAYILLTGEHPFLMPDERLDYDLTSGKKNTNIVSLMRLQYADWQWTHVQVSSTARDFIEQIGQEFPEKRTSLKDILDHPFLTRKVIIGKQLKLATVKQMYSDSTADQGEMMSTTNILSREPSHPAWVKDLQEENRRLKFELKLKLNPDTIGHEDEDLMPVNPVDTYTPHMAITHMLGMLA